MIGAVNIWCWEPDAVSLVKEMQSAGIERILWSNAQSPENLRALNDLGVLTSRYDIYQDLMDPAQFPRLRWTHPDWTTAGWPQDIMIEADGQWTKGWGVEARDGSMIHCGVLCDLRAPEYARPFTPWRPFRHFVLSSLPASAVSAFPKSLIHCSVGRWKLGRGLTQFFCFLLFDILPGAARYRSRHIL